MHYFMSLWIVVVWELTQLTSPAVVWELMEILQEPPPWQNTVVVISCLVSRAAISSWEGTYSLPLVLFRDSPVNKANCSISVEGYSSLILGKQSSEG